MASITETFGSLVFNDDVMKERLPKDTYKALQKAISENMELDKAVANSIANAMKEWALEKGCTHYTHWFQPMTGITAEKHDSFVGVDHSTGKMILEFSGKELIKGEPDASSFPSGGLRATFEARGYTSWDPTSYAFIKDNTLCIPTAFCSYGGEALDKKTPLLRSMEVVNDECMRILKLFGRTDAKSVITTVGAEQEYFLIDKNVYKKRKDLVFTGRTLFGARAPKGQELEDHYFGSIKPRVKEFMKDLDEELWKLGVLAKTEHNEVAPAQHELAPIFTNTNIANDHNQIMMEMMKKLADRHNMSCLLHEKPFAGVNGSGKHNNWSLCTDTGYNLLDPGKHPHESMQFLLFLTAVIKAVDEYQDLLRVCVSSAGNDHRLGANEAPPAIVSMYLGDELTEILEAFTNENAYDKKSKKLMQTDIHVLPVFAQDTTDRNRTSPFAFTGNKFEFRMLGSTFSIAGPNIVLNTAVAEELGKFADELEKAENFETAVGALIKREVKAHRRIIFNGNNYSEEWVKEAEKRGLSNLRTTVDAIPKFIEQKSINLFTKHKIFTEKEIFSRYEILVENYSKIISIEALTMLDMAKKDILPAVTKYSKMLAETASLKASVGEMISCEAEVTQLKNISALSASLFHKIEALDSAVMGAKEHESDSLDTATYYKDSVLPAMQELRAVADALEMLVGGEFWPFPTYGELLFSV